MQKDIYISIQHGDSRLIIDGSFDLFGDFIQTYIQQTYKLPNNDKPAVADEIIQALTEKKINVGAADDKQE